MLNACTANNKHTELTGHGHVRLSVTVDSIGYRGACSSLIIYDIVHAIVYALGLHMRGVHLKRKLMTNILKS